MNGLQKQETAELVQHPLFGSVLEDLKKLCDDEGLSPHARSLARTSLNVLKNNTGLGEAPPGGYRNRE